MLPITLQTPLGDIQNQTDFLGIHSFFLFNRSKFLFSIFTQNKNFQKPNIEVKGAPLASADNAPSNPACLPLSSTPLYFYCSVKLLFP